MAKDSGGWAPYLIVGLIVGIPVGVALLWFFTQRPSSPTYVPAATPSASPTYVNEEKWKWIDWRGREREITVHRMVRAL